MKGVPALSWTLRQEGKMVFRERSQKPQREREKGIHCSHSHSFSSSYIEATGLGDISEASQLYDLIGKSRNSPYINSLTGRNNTLYSIMIGVRFR